MALLEVFVHPGCLSERPALALIDDIRKEFPAWQIRVWRSGQERARALGIIIVPAFVLNGTLVAVGIPRREWLVKKLREHSQRSHRI